MSPHNSPKREFQLKASNLDKNKEYNIRYELTWREIILKTTWQNSCTTTHEFT
jgi:hypothetical protein